MFQHGIDVTFPDGGGEHDERAVLERTIESDRLYVMDRGYAKFALFNAIVAAQSSYVCRLRDNSVYEVLETRPLKPTPTARGRNPQRRNCAVLERQGACAAGSSVAADPHCHFASYQPRQIWQRFRTGPESTTASCESPPESARCSGGNHRAGSTSSDGRLKSFSDFSSTSWVAATSSATARTALPCRRTVQSSPVWSSHCIRDASPRFAPTR